MYNSRLKVSKVHYDEVKEAFISNMPKLKEYATTIAVSGNYRQFHVRVGFEAIRAFMPKNYISNVLYEYINDDHISSMLKALFNELELTPNKLKVVK